MKYRLQRTFGFEIMHIEPHPAVQKPQIDTKSMRAGREPGPCRQELLCSAFENAAEFEPLLEYLCDRCARRQ
jgi:hypothetical protein